MPFEDICAILSVMPWLLLFGYIALCEGLPAWMDYQDLRDELRATATED